MCVGSLVLGCVCIWAAGPGLFRRAARRICGGVDAIATIDVVVLVCRRYAPLGPTRRRRDAGCGVWVWGGVWGRERREHVWGNPVGASGGRRMAGAGGCAAERACD